MAKRILSFLLITLLCLTCLLPAACAIADAAYTALATQNLSGRSGPGTQYDELGTYKVKGEYVGIYTCAYDVNDVCWLQAEVLYGGKLRRVYTGLKRFDADTVDDNLPSENFLYGDAEVKVLETSKAKYGPGAKYDTYSYLTVDKGMTVTCLCTENGYAHIEFEAYSNRLDRRQSYRCWVPESTLALE